MSNTFSFSTAGATPNVQKPLSAGSLNLGFTPHTGSTSQSRALDSGGMGGYQPPKVTIPPAPTPNQDVKKITHSDAAGGSQTIEYHPGMIPSSSTPSPKTFPETVSALADTSQQGSPTANKSADQLSQTQAGTPATQGYIKQTADYGAGNTEIGQRAAEIAANYGKRIADVGGQGARFEAGQLTTGTSPVAEGNAAVIAQTTAAQQTALAQGESAALEGTAQELTGQNQAANAANAAAGQSNTAQGTQVTGQYNAGQIANTSQSQRQSGLNDAGQLAKPELGNIGQVPYSPTTLQQGDVLGTQQPGGVQAAGNLLGQFQGAQTAGAAGGNVAAHNAITAGTAGVDANKQVFQDAYGTYKDLENTVKNVDQFGTLLTSGMTAADGTIINPSNVKYANMKIADLRSQLSSGQQAQFDSTLAALQSKVSGLLAVGGKEIPTKLSSDASQIVDGSLPYKSLKDVLTRIQAEGNIILNNQADVVNSAYSGIQGGSQNSTSNQGGGGQGNPSPQRNSVFSW